MLFRSDVGRRAFREASFQGKNLLDALTCDIVSIVGVVLFFQLRPDVVPKTAGICVV